VATSSTLTRLLSDLKAVRSPLDRMRVLARAWRSLRRLGADERKVLAGQVGMEGAEELLEGLGRGEKRLAPVLVLRALEKAKKADPSQLRDLVSGLKDRDKRGTILQKWLNSVADDLDDQEEEPVDAPIETAPEAPQPEPAAMPATAEKTPPSSEPNRAIPVAAPPLAIPVGSALPKLAPKPQPKIGPSAAAPRPAPSRRVPPPVPVPIPVPWSKPASAAAKPVPEQTPRFDAATPAGEPLADRLHHTDSLMKRFRVLRSGLDSNGGSNTGDVTHLLEAFPAGWARRRALEALLRRHIPADLSSALKLIEDQKSSAARRWCLGTILEHWKLSAEQQDQLRRSRR
jgi:hypothetical protein